MTIQCCVCHKVKEQGEWIRPTQTVSNASHTYCPVCLEDCMHTVRIELMNRKSNVSAVAG